MTTIEPGFGPQESTVLSGGAAGFAELMSPAATMIASGDAAQARRCGDLLRYVDGELGLAQAALITARYLQREGDTQGAGEAARSAINHASRASDTIAQILSGCRGVLSDAELAELEEVKGEVDRMLGRSGQGVSDFLGSVGNAIGWAAGGVFYVLQQLLNRSPDAAY